MSTPRKVPLLHRAARAWRRTEGAAAVEMALWVGILVIPMLSVADVGMYAYQKMEVENAAQMASQAAWKLCDISSKLPAVTNCPTLLSTLNTAAQGTGLGTAVTITAVTERYYCTNAASTPPLVPVGTQGTLSPPGTTPATPVPPANCNAVLGTGIAPADYISITTRYTYTPAFGNISIAAFLPTPITQTSIMRLN